jgi:hypothetical protein
VHVAAGRDSEAGQRRARQVGRHHRRRAAQEGEGRDQHAGVAHGHELLDALGVLLLEDVDGIGPVGRLVVGGVGRARHLLAQRLAGCQPLLDRGPARLEGLRQCAALLAVEQAVVARIDVCPEVDDAHVPSLVAAR